MSGHGVPVQRVTSGFRKVARRFLAKGWVPVQFGASGFRWVARRFPARDWVLEKQTRIAPGSPIQTKHGGPFADTHGDGGGGGDGDGGGSRMSIPKQQ